MFLMASWEINSEKYFEVNFTLFLVAIVAFLPFNCCSLVFLYHIIDIFMIN